MNVDTHLAILTPLMFKKRLSFSIYINQDAQQLLAMIDCMSYLYRT